MLHPVPSTFRNPKLLIQPGVALMGKEAVKQEKMKKMMGNEEGFCKVKTSIETLVRNRKCGIPGKALIRLPQLKWKAVNCLEGDGVGESPKSHPVSLPPPFW